MNNNRIIRILLTPGLIVGVLIAIVYRDYFDAAALIDSNSSLVLDVRTAEDFIGEQGHIDIAVNIAVKELPDRMDELTEYIERPIAIVCRTDKRSAKAALLLTEEGFHDVHVVRGGMTKWIEANLPVIR